MNDMNKHTMLSTALLVIMIAVSLPAFIGLSMEITIILLILYVVILSSFSFIHGAQMLGKKQIFVFFCIAVIVTYLMEWLGTHFGIPFGHYYYTNRLGPMIMDVPIAIPFQWFNILYASYIMSQIFLSRWTSQRRSNRQDDTQERPHSREYLRMLATSIIVGLFMVSWDFINDPYMVGVGMWVWTNPTEFWGLMLFGIPLSNFLGWILTSAAATLIFELYQYHKEHIREELVRSDVDRGKILVLVPYAYAYAFQTLNGITSGVLSLQSVNGWGPMMLAAISGGIAVAITIWGYIRTPSTLIGMPT
jgi:uncharacterized membrane protein